MFSIILFLLLGVWLVCYGLLISLVIFPAIDMISFYEGRKISFWVFFFDRANLMLLGLSPIILIGSLKIGITKCREMVLTAWMDT